MKKCILIIVLFSLISACNKNNQDDGISAYKNKDYITAFALSEKGCREKNGEACYILANIYYMGLSHHIDHVKAARYYIISCEIGNGRACYMMGKLYSESRIIPEDIDQSEAYYRKSNKILTKECNAGNPESCLYAGALYLYSRGVPHDTSKAVSFFEKSCKMDYASGCYTIGDLLNTGRYGIMKNHDMAHSYLNKACKLGYKEACK